MSKYPALNPRLNGRIRQSTLDQDYLDKLTDKQKQWLNDFVEETNNASPGKRFYKTKAQKREIYNQNNARQRDITSIKVATGGLDQWDKTTETYLETECAQSKDDIENALIEHLDDKYKKDE